MFWVLSVYCILFKTQHTNETRTGRVVSRVQAQSLRYRFRNQIRYDNIIDDTVCAREWRLGIPPIAKHGEVII